MLLLITPYKNYSPFKLLLLLLSVTEFTCQWSYGSSVVQEIWLQFEDR